MANALVAILWHFHQPLYREPGTARAAMPWVRLHATKGYTDLVALLDEFPNVRVTINVVPSLLDQLDGYASGATEDPSLALMQTPPDSLSREDAWRVLRVGFQVNRTTQVHPVRRYRELLEHRGTALPPGAPSDEILRRFTVQDLRDLQVWHTLAWMGFTLRQRDPVVAAAVAKERGFTEEEKAALLGVQARAVADVVPRLTAAANRGQVELTTSPYYHPILPLLISTDLTRRAQPDAQVPVLPFSAPEDAQAQVALAVEAHTRRFGTAPRGCWPSEGSVCPEVVPILAEAGFAWCASDEGVLAKSAAVREGLPSVTQPYRVFAHGQEITMVFRSRDLSDRIGFTYASNPGAEAAHDFLARSTALASGAPCRPALVPVILDGENPWEYYPDGGEHFLRALYQAAETQPGVEFATFSEAVARVEARPDIRDLHSGSWIRSNFEIWGDGPAESAAWDALRRTRAFLVRQEQTHPELEADIRTTAWQYLYAAEGSDWFWWYGTDFNSENDAEFDRLFRMYLEGVYRMCGVEPPADLQAPHLVEAETLGVRQPSAFVRPVLDGRVTDFYEWAGSGGMDASSGQAMHRSACAVRALYFGFDATTLYVRTDLDLPIQNTDGTPAELRWLLEGPGVWRLRCPAEPKPRAVLHLDGVNCAGAFEQVDTIETIAVDRIVELAVPWARLGARPEDVFGLSVHVFRDGLATARVPAAGALPVQVPAATFAGTMWLV